MSWSVLFFIQIAVGALIGGVTNELAIRMLFRPYRAYYIGKWRIPFTPGLIPKRHDELAYQMGKLVENFLITPDAVRKILLKGDAEQEIYAWIKARVDYLLTSEESISSLLEKAGFPLTEDRKKEIQKFTQQYLLKKVGKASHYTLEDLLPIEIRAMIEAKAPDMAGFILNKFGQYIKSGDGENTIRQFLSQIAGGLGMFGGLAGMLLADEKVVSKVSASLESITQKEELKERLSSILLKEIKHLWNKPIEEFIHWVGEEKITTAVHHLTESIIVSGHWNQEPLRNWLNPISANIDEWISQVACRIVQWVEANLEKALAKINLTKIASSQVITFPVNKLEEMIVSITGKELKMITVIGALLGGVIGAIQALIVRIGL